MESKIAKAIEMKYQPVGVLLANERPEDALQFKEGRWGCVAAMMSAAAKGKTVVFDRKTYGCIGGGTGLGFGNLYVHFPGGIEYFLSTGNDDFCSTEIGKNIVRNMPALAEGERYLKNPEIARKFIDCLPMVDVPAEYVIFKPLAQFTENEIPKVVTFLANPDQLSALVVLANYERETNLNVIAPFGAGCHSTCIIPYKEDELEKPRAVLGMFDISARKCVDKDILSFTVPYKMFLEIEDNVEGSFLEKHEWQRVLERNR
ncbi:MAG: DUF169 domain-containing protein [Bacillota bacterium]|nr:DUF169 domain-containing protein [Bacillota bacterium]